MPRIFPLQLRPQTAIYKPSPRGGLVIPNRRFDSADIPDVLTGLVSQADVNTDGRVDTAPFDNILGNLGTLVNGPTVVGGNDGGYFGMLFDGVNQTLTLPSTLDNNLFLEGDFSMAVRLKFTVPGVQGEMGGFAFGPTALCSLKAQGFDGNPQAFCIDDGSQNTSVPGANLNSNDGDEHVLILRRQGNRIQAAMDLTPWGDVDGSYGNGGGTTTNHQEWASFYDDTPIIFLAGTILWSAAWDRLLSTTQAAFLSASPNPFGRVPTGLVAGLVAQADVNTDARTDNAPFDHVQSVVATLNNAPTVTTGDGGYSAMAYDGVDQWAILPTVAPSNAFLGVAFTVAVRFSTTTTVVGSMYGFGDTTRAAPLLGMQSAFNVAGAIEGFVQNLNGQFAQNISTVGFNDGLEHVVAMRFDPTLFVGVEMFVDGVLNGGGGLQNYTGPNNPDTSVQGAFFSSSVPEQFFDGDVFWSASWNRALRDDEMVELFASENPFGRGP